MDPDEPASSITRILVALDADPLGSGILEVAARFAVQLQGELSGLFVQDMNLLRLTGLPFAQRSGLWSRGRPVTFQSLQRDMEATAETMRAALGQLATQEQLPWSFEVVQGSLTRVLLETSQQADVLLIVRQTMAVYAPNQPVPPVRPSGRSTVVLFEDSASSARVLRAALQLHADQPERITILLAADRERLPALRKHVAEICGANSRRVSVLPDAIAYPEQLCATVHRLVPGLVLMSRESPLIGHANLVTFASRLNCPLGLFR
jgi:nucleotide-binding universal stress UspA family protein